MVSFQLFFFAVVIATMTANVVVGVIAKEGNMRLDWVHAARVGATGAGLMCFPGLFIVLLASFVLCLVKRCTTY